jgi:mannose-6-phosphate isomerase-like protein (cupin superfamily)
MTGPRQPPANIVRAADLEWVSNETADPRMWPMDRIRWKTLVSRERNGSEDLLVGVAELDPGDVHVLHDHPASSEVYYILQGQARVVMGDGEYTVGPGTAVYFPPQTKHAVRNVGDQVLVLLWAFNKGAEEPERWDERYHR